MGGQGGTYHSGQYEEAPPKRGTFFRFEVYLTIIPLVRVRYKMVDSQRGARHRVGYLPSHIPTSASGIIVLLILFYSNYRIVLF